MGDRVKSASKQYGLIQKTLDALYERRMTPGEVNPCENGPLTISRILGARPAQFDLRISKRALRQVSGVGAGRPKNGQ